MPIEEVNKVLEKRKQSWTPKPPKYKTGVLRMFARHAVSPMKGAYLEYDD